MTWGQLRRLLVTEGEAISPEDLEAYLSALVGGGGNAGLSSLLEDSLFDANSFAGSSRHNTINYSLK